jgi:hypothetical protein
MNKYTCPSISAFGRAGLVAFMICCVLSSCSFHRLALWKKNKSNGWDTLQPAPDTGRIIGPQPYVAAPARDTVKKAADSLAKVNRLIDQLTPLWKNRLAYNTFSGKARVRFEGPDTKQEFTAHFRIRRDSAIWIAITGMGGMVPVARILITKDSFMMINQLQKEVTLLPLEEAAKILPAKVDFSSMQSLVTGEPIRDGIITNASGSGSAWVIEVEDRDYIQRISYNKSDSSMHTAQLGTRDLTGPIAMTEYGSYMVIDNHKISTGRVINVQNGGDIYTIDLNFMKIDFDQPLDFPFSIPDNYTLRQK